ncbi:MAG: hypothetical protein ACO1RX_22730 [Candidatus Sericytochromatia bacterium]
MVKRIGEGLSSVPIPTPRPKDLQPAASPSLSAVSVTPTPQLNLNSEANLTRVRQDNMSRQLPGGGFPTRQVAQNGAVQAPAQNGDPTIDQMAASIRSFPGSKATDVATSRAIAEAAQSAAREFGIDPRQLIAVWGRESQFEPGVSTGNGTGLGQITRPAVQELARISRGGSNGTRAGVSQETYAMLRTRGPGSAGDLFRGLDAAGGATRRSRLQDIQTNARVSAAYLRLMIDVNNGRGNGGNSTTILRAYNGHGGAIERAYPGHIRDSYQDLWGSALPDTMRTR